MTMVFAGTGTAGASYIGTQTRRLKLGRHGDWRRIGFANRANKVHRRLGHAAEIARRQLLQVRRGIEGIDHEAREALGHNSRSDLAENEFAP